MLLLTLALALSAQPQETAATIMARVAANQDRSESERQHYTYIQHAKTTSRKGKTVRCEEITDFRVTPTATGSSQQLLKLEGKLLGKHNRYATYTTLSPKEDAKVDNKDDTRHTTDDDISITNDDSMDRDLVENMRHNLTSDTSKDGLAKGLFPLTSKQQAEYDFTLLGREPKNGHDTFHIHFAPKDKDDFGWKGEAFIDTTAYQPVVVQTTMARNIPFAVRALLGTSVPGLGFTVIYAPQPSDKPDALWFPASFGTEFKLHVLFFLNRQIILSAQNRDFEKTHVTSTLSGGTTPVTPEE